MHCIHVNVCTALLIIISIVFNNIQRSQMASQTELSPKDLLQKATYVNHSDPNTVRTPVRNIPTKNADAILYCPSHMQCKDMTPPCIECDYKLNCVYGKITNTTCRVHNMVKCQGRRQFDTTLICRYCYQTEPWEHSCDLKGNCNSVNTPNQYFRTNCTVNKNVLCFGHRTFNKNVKCNWTGGYRWSTALILSVTLGGFGADRFYLGHWQEGIGKLFSFGGLGVWTLIDVILISLHYLGPADGSLYI